MDQICMNDSWPSSILGVDPWRLLTAQGELLKAFNKNLLLLSEFCLASVLRSHSKASVLLLSETEVISSGA